MHCWSRRLRERLYRLGQAGVFFLYKYEMLSKTMLVLYLKHRARITNHYGKYWRGTKLNQNYTEACFPLFTEDESIKTLI